MLTCVNVSLEMIPESQRNLENTKRQIAEVSSKKPNEAISNHNTTQNGTEKALPEAHIHVAYEPSKQPRSNLTLPEHATVFKSI